MQHELRDGILYIYIYKYTYVRILINTYYIYTHRFLVQTCLIHLISLKIRDPPGIGPGWTAFPMPGTVGTWRLGRGKLVGGFRLGDLGEIIEVNGSCWLIYGESMVNLWIIYA